MLIPVAERHMREHDVAPRRAPPFLGNGALRLGEKGVDALHARHGRLDGLDLRAETFNGRKNAGDAADNGDGGADGHTEQRQDLRFSGGGKQHDGADHGGVEQQHDRRVNCVVEIRPLHGGVALADAPVVAALHIVLQSQQADGADVAQRFRHLPGHGGDGAAVIELRRERPLLHMACEHGEQRQHQQQYQCKTGVFYRNNGHDRENAAGVRRHADDAGGEKRFHGVHIAGKARGDLAGVLAHKRVGGQKHQLPGHFRAQRVGHFLTGEHEQALLCAGQYPLQRESAEIEERRERGEGQTAGQPVNDAPEQQRRNERRPCAGRRTEKRAGGKKRLRRGGGPDHGESAVIPSLLHALPLLSGSRRAGGTPERTPSARRACRRRFSRRP